MTSPTPQHYPVLIVGGGAAGTTAAIYLTRAGIPTAVAEGYYMSATEIPGGQVATTPDIENYPGYFPEGDTKPGATLMDTMKKQAQHHGATYLTDTRVTHINYNTTPFTIHTETWGEPQPPITANKILLATGAQVRTLNLPGEEHYAGRGVSYCATCDGAFFANKNVTIIGGGDVAVEDALYLADIAKTVTILIRANTYTSTQHHLIQQITNHPNITTLFNTRATHIHGDNTTVTHLTLTTGETTRTHPTDGVFVAIGRDPQTELLTHHNPNLTTNGYAITDDTGATRIPGVYVAGDMTDPIYRQAIIAAASGARAAMTITRDEHANHATL